MPQLLQNRQRRRYREGISLASILGLLLAALAACGAPGAGEPGTPTPDYPAPAASAAPPSYPAPARPAAATLPPYPDVSAPAMATPAIPTFGSTPTFVPPPTPEMPIAQALMRIGPQALLYNRPEGYLMLADITHGQQLWVTALDDPTCRAPDGNVLQSGIWSADGRFLSVTCQAGDYPGGPLVAYLFDRAAGPVHQLLPASGSDAQVVLQPQAWAPTDDRLLVKEYSPRTTTAHWSIIDAPTGARAPLIDVALTHGDPSHAALWSPDGQKLALLTDTGFAIVRADGTGSQTIDDSMAFTIFGMLWSPDGRYLYFGYSGVDPHIQPTGARLEIASGTVERLSTTPAIAFSPDGTRYLATHFVEPSSILDWNIWSIDGSHRSDSGVGYAAWLPDGSLGESRCERPSNSVAPAPAQIWLSTTDRTARLLITTDSCLGVYPSSDSSLIALSNGLVIDLQGKQQALIPGCVGNHVPQSRDMWLPIP